MDINTFIALALGVVGSLGIEFLKDISRKWNLPDVTGKDGLIFLAIIAGGVYAAWFYIVPIELQDNIVAFVVKALGAAVLVYEFLLKNNSMD